MICFGKLLVDYLLGIDELKVELEPEIKILNVHY
jgi:hypothetical protein